MAGEEEATALVGSRIGWALVVEVGLQQFAGTLD